jgi:hypothetical protein
VIVAGDRDPFSGQRDADAERQLERLDVAVVASEQLVQPPLIGELDFSR